jgi:hypothetical protein
MNIYKNHKSDVHLLAIQTVLFFGLIVVKASSVVLALHCFVMVLGMLKLYKKAKISSQPERQSHE